MKKFVFNMLTKFEYVGYALVILLWIAGAVLTILGFPWITLGIVAMHACEVVFIGIPVSRKAGEGLIYSIAMCMMFGFFWWIPLKTKNGLAEF